MILEIVTYGHPVLRTRGQKITHIDDPMRQLAADMIDTMHHKMGVGLAAQQIGRPLQLFVLGVLQNENRSSQMWVEGNSVPFDPLMPMVVVNPEIEPEEEEVVSDQEGCLSFPEVFGNVERPARVRLRAHDLEGNPIEFRAEGLLARAVQHEFDHLQGVLFIDRMAPSTRQELEPTLAAFKRPSDMAKFS